MWRALLGHVEEESFEEEKKKIDVATEELLRRLEETRNERELVEVVGQLTRVVRVQPEELEAVSKNVGKCVRALGEYRGVPSVASGMLELLCALTVGREKDSQLAYLPMVHCTQLAEDEGTMRIVFEALGDRAGLVRVQGAALLENVVAVARGPLQARVLGLPEASAAVLGLIEDRRESVRDAGIRLVQRLAAENQEIQKIFVFEGTIEALLQVMRAEGYCKGGPVVCEALHALRDLLEGSAQSQSYFRETRGFAALEPLLAFEPRREAFVLPDSKRLILLSTLRLLGYLCGETCPSAEANRAAVRDTNILPFVVTLALGRISFPDLRAQALSTAGDAILHDEASREMFLRGVFVDPDTAEHVPVLHRLLAIAFFSQLLGERLMALRAFGCYFLENSEGQLLLASTLNPQPDDDPDVAGAEPDYTQPASVSPATPLGRLLLDVLRRWDSVAAADDNELKPFFSAALLSYLVRGSDSCKAIMARIPLEIPLPDVPSSSLLEWCVAALVENCRVSHDDDLRKVALLRLLCTWVDGSAPTAGQALQPELGLLQAAVDVFQPAPGPQNTQVQGLVALLLAQCALVLPEGPPRSAISAVIAHHVGEDKLLKRMSALRRSEPFLLAEQDAAVPADIGLASDKVAPFIMYDYPFALMFKDVQERFARRGIEPPRAAPTQPAPPAADPADRARIAELEAEVDLLRSKLAESERMRESAEKDLASLSTSFNDIEAELHNITRPTVSEDEFREAIVQLAELSERNEELEEENRRLKLEIEVLR